MEPWQHHELSDSRVQGAHRDLKGHSLQVRLHAMHLGDVLPVPHKRLGKNFDGVLQ
jgi:hypothetical protein